MGQVGAVAGTTRGDYRRAVAYLKALSDTTGGRFYSGDSMFGIGQAFTWIAEELGRAIQSWLLPNTPPAKMVNDGR